MLLVSEKTPGKHVASLNGQVFSSERDAFQSLHATQHLNDLNYEMFGSCSDLQKWRGLLNIPALNVFSLTGLFMQLKASLRENSLQIKVKLSKDYPKSPCDMRKVYVAKHNSPLSRSDFRL